MSQASHGSQPTHAAACLGFPMAILFTDVEPQVLADEAATELTDNNVWSPGALQAYPGHVPPAFERGSAPHMADMVRQN